MGRPPLPLGTWGKIRRYQLTASTWRAATNYRDFDGVTRRIQRTGGSGAKAERNLLLALTQRARVGRTGEITGETRISDIAPVWLEALQNSKKKPSTIDAYSDALRIHVLPGVGALQVRELTVGGADRFLAAVQKKSGTGAAKHARTVLSQIMGMAARNDAIQYNPIRDTAPLSSESKDVRAFTLDEVRQVRAGLAADPKAVERDIVDLVDFMLGTGVRIGECLAVTEAAVDLQAATVEIRGTVVRSRALGNVVQPKPKTRSGWRALHLPPWLVLVLKAREYPANEWGVIFPTPLGKLRDRSNTTADLREALDALGFEWATSHTFRKTAATLLDGGGLTVREIADQLGHKRVSVTQDVYFGRGAAPASAGRVLDAIGEESR